MPRRRRAAQMPPSGDARLPFLVKCSDGHGRKAPALLHRGALVTAPGDPPAVEWAAGAPALGEPKDDGDCKVTLHCSACGRNTEIKASLLMRAVRALADAGLKDGSGRVTLDIAKVPR